MSSHEIQAVTDNQGEKPKLKPCCACPETKKPRDACFCPDGIRSVYTEKMHFHVPLSYISVGWNAMVASFHSSIIEKGEEHCADLIEAHKECMRKLGFKI